MKVIILLNNQLHHKVIFSLEELSDLVTCGKQKHAIFALLNHSCLAFLSQLINLFSVVVGLVFICSWRPKEDFVTRV